MLRGLEMRLDHRAAADQGRAVATPLARINAADTTEIERWGERILSAQTLAEVLDEPS